LADPKPLIDVDLTTIWEALDLTKLSANWEIADTSAINCFAVWADIQLSEAVSISTIDSSSWSIMLYRIESFEKQSGNLEFKLSLTSSTNHWTARLVRDDFQGEQTYSPAKAATELLVQTRTDPKAFSHLQQLGLLSHTFENAETDS
jgi:hypothetical protein